MWGSMEREKGCYGHDLPKVFLQASSYGKITVSLDPQENNMNLGKRPGCPYRQFRVELRLEQ